MSTQPHARPLLLKTLLIASVLSAPAIFPAGVFGATVYWTGGAGASPNNVWTNDNNWSLTSGTVSSYTLAEGDDIVFEVGVHASSNDLAPGFDVNSITFAASLTQATNVTGNSIDLLGDVTNNSSHFQEISLDMVIAGTRIFNAAAGNLQVAGEISGSGGVTIGGAHSVRYMGDAKTYTGDTTISGGATLTLFNDNMLPDTSSLVLNGGTFQAGIYDDTAGILTVSASSIIDMGNGSSVLKFANTAQPSITGTLSVYNWDYPAWTTGNAEQIKFDAYAGPGYQLTSTQFYSGAGTSAIGSGGAILNGELVPVPEAGTTLGVLALAGLAGWRERRHFLRCREARRR